MLVLKGDILMMLRRIAQELESICITVEEMLVWEWHLEFGPDKLEGRDVVIAWDNLLLKLFALLDNSCYYSFYNWYLSVRSAHRVY